MASRRPVFALNALSGEPHAARADWLTPVPITVILGMIKTVRAVCKPVCLMG
jgi:hypothetical protein